MSDTSDSGQGRARGKLVVALDKPNCAEALSLVDQLGDEVTIYKVGLELVFGGGLDLARELKSRGKLIFLDMKLLDIPNTVEKAVANIASQDFDFLTVHASDRKTLAAAVRGRDAGDKRRPHDRLKLLAVTVLTSLTAEDIRVDQGLQLSPHELALRRAVMACDEGFDGVIASGHEASAIRGATNSKFIIKVPGIRPRGAAIGDQSRVMTPSEALRAGASYLVIGRPISEAASPVDMVRRILAEMQSV